MCVFKFLKYILFTFFYNIKTKKRSPDLPLNEEIITESLLLLCKIGNGLAHAYVRLDAAQK